MAAFRARPANLAVVQVPLQLHNGGDSWIARQFALDYAIHFRVWLPLLAQLRLPIPQCGASNYFRSRMLQEVGGWDAWKLAEDADIGIRLARFGYEAGMVSPAPLEEAPTRWRLWKNQRTRWIKGHMQTWLALNRRLPARPARHGGRSLHINACDAWRRLTCRPAPWTAVCMDCSKPVHFPQYRGVALDHVRAWLSQRRRRGSGLALDARHALDNDDDAALLATAIVGDDHRVMRNALQAARLLQDPAWADDLATGDVGRHAGTLRTTRRKWGAAEPPLFFTRRDNSSRAVVLPDTCPACATTALLRTWTGPSP